MIPAQRRPRIFIVFPPRAPDTPRDMIKALLLIFEPMAAWERVALARRSLGNILLTFLLPMIVLSAAVEGYGLVRWGKWQEYPEYLRTFSPGEAVVYEAAQSLLSLLVVSIGAKILKALGETFHGRHTFTQTFTVVAYGLSPMFLLRVCDAFKFVNPWTSWAIGIVLCVGVLYQGVPRVMLPDPPHAFGLFLMSSLLLVFITGLARFVTAWYLTGHFKPVDQLITAIAGRLPF